MTTAYQIDQAIGAHGLWRSKLRAAVESGRVEASLHELLASDRCLFGKWMHGTSISPADRASPHWATVERLHARFHWVAAHVAERVKRGELNAARASLERTGEFGIASSELTAAMLRWKQSLDQTDGTRATR